MRHYHIAHQLIHTLHKLLCVRVNDYHGYLYGFDIRKGVPLQPVYTEITGYGLSMNVFLHTLGNYNVHAITFSFLKFLIEACSKTKDLVALYGYYLDGKWSSLAFSFDNGVVAKAFFDAYEVFKLKNAMNYGLRICEWLTNFMQQSDGSFRVAYDYSKNRFIDFKAWFGSRGCLHGKLAIPLLLAWRFSRNDMYRCSAEKLIAWLLRLQLDSGAFRARQFDDYVFSHAHCYALEGLLYAWYMLKRDEYLHSAIRGATWLIKIQHKSGGIPERYPCSFLKRLASDATAQAVRIWLIIYKVVGDDIWLRYAERALNFLANISVKQKGYCILPAYLYPMSLLNRVLLKVHTWSLMFAIQAFLMYEYIDKVTLDDMLRRLF